MNGIEQRIINKVYKLEAKKMSFSFVFTVIFLSGALFITVLFSQIFIEIFQEQRIGTVFVIFTEGWDVFVNQVNDLLHIIMNEIPYSVTLIIIFSFILFIIISLTIIRNFGKIRNKVNALIMYWGKKSL